MIPNFQGLPWFEFDGLGDDELLLWFLMNRKSEGTVVVFYVYWTVHHLDSWVKRDQLDVTWFIISLFNAKHVSDVNTSILRTLRLICWVISWVVLLWFDVCWCYFVVWLGWCGIRTQAEALVSQPAYGYHTTTAKPQRNIRNMLSIK